MKRNIKPWKRWFGSLGRSLIQPELIKASSSLQPRKYHNQLRLPLIRSSSKMSAMALSNSLTSPLPSHSSSPLSFPVPRTNFVSFKSPRSFTLSCSLNGADPSDKEIPIEKSNESFFFFWVEIFGALSRCFFYLWGCSVDLLWQGFRHFRLWWISTRFVRFCLTGESIVVHYLLFSCLGRML